MSRAATGRSFAAFAVLSVACGARTGIDEGAAPSAADAAVTVDSGAPDTSPPSPDAYVTVPDGGCRSNAACNDGLACTTDSCDTATGDCLHVPEDGLCPVVPYCGGDESCDPQTGCTDTPRNCDDGVACTVDSCSGPAAACMHVPDDALCPVGFACDRVLGCVARGFAETPGALFAVRLPSGATALQTVTDTSLDDIALHPDGTLYAVDSGALYTLDPTAGVATMIGPTAASLNALDAAPDGTLYGAGGGEVFTVDIATGALTPLVEYPAGLSSSGDLAIIGNTLLASVTGATADGSDAIVSVDLTTLGATVVGTTGFTCIYGLAAYGTSLFGFTCKGEVLSIDPATASTTLITGAGEMFYGATAR